MGSALSGRGRRGGFLSWFVVCGLLHSKAVECEILSASDVERVYQIRWRFLFVAVLESILLQPEESLSILVGNSSVVAVEYRVPLVLAAWLDKFSGGLQMWSGLPSNQSSNDCSGTNWPHLRHECPVALGIIVFAVLTMNSSIHKLKLTHDFTTSNTYIRRKEER